MKKKAFLLIPLAAVIVSSFLLFTTADYKVSDLFQRILKSTAETSRVMMINIDDAAMEEIGAWPLSRDVYADSIINLRELGAAGIVFDLSFTDKSAAKVDESYLETNLPSSVNSILENVKNGTSSLSQAEKDILTAVSGTVTKSDEVLANALSFVGNSTLAITMVNYDFLDANEEQFMAENIALKNLVVKDDTITPEFKSIMISIPELMHKAKNAGFVNADVDSDGYLRRLHLVTKFNGQYYGQLVFNSILKYYGNPAVEISNSSIVLKDAVLKFDEEGNAVEKGDVTIPRSEDGSVLIKYPKKQYNQYNQSSIWPVYRLTKLEQALKENVDSMEQSNLFEGLEDNPAQIYESMQQYKQELFNGENEAEGLTIEDYVAYKEAYLEAITYALSDEYRAYLLEQYQDEAAYINSVFDEYSSTLSKVLEAREILSKQIKDTVCIIGTTATSTTDWGIIQYEDHYPNPGVHYALANMLRARDFIDDSSPVISVLLALILCFVYSFVANKIKGTGRQIVTGILFTILSLVLLLGYFVATRTYVGAVVPVSSVLLTFVITTVIGFLTASKDKKFITNAFSQCLSKEVVNEIVANPSSFKLGGQRLEMTAIFTDIQKFSGFSELLTASQLVALLNYYLTEMSDIIMEERGTVDKYEGDAIIALVGAPVKMDDHGVRAVAAALKMKAAEVIMNEEIQKIAAGEKPETMEQDLYDAFKVMVQNKRTIFTRIGLNSGEMIAGYMGSENKKNYTMMGNNVNLASRLEGVNKQYSTGGILMSEATCKLLGDRFIVRRLDRVRVVNVNTPIRLYEPLAEKASADEALLGYVRDWEGAMDLFEEKQYDQALEAFKKLLQIKPSDKTAAYYSSLLENFFCKGRYPMEADGVGVEYMPEDNVFKLLQK